MMVNMYQVKELDVVLKLINIIFSKLCVPLLLFKICVLKIILPAKFIL